MASVAMVTESFPAGVQRSPGSFLLQVARHKGRVCQTAQSQQLHSFTEKHQGALAEKGLAKAELTCSTTQRSSAEHGGAGSLGRVSQWYKTQKRRLARKLDRWGARSLSATSGSAIPLLELSGYNWGHLAF